MTHITSTYAKIVVMHSDGFRCDVSSYQSDDEAARHFRKRATPGVTGYWHWLRSEISTIMVSNHELAEYHQWLTKEAHKVDERIAEVVANGLAP